MKEEISLNIENSNLGNINFRFLKGQTTVILGKNDFAKKDLLDYINSLYSKKSSYEVFYSKNDRGIISYLKKPIDFKIKRVLLLSTKGKTSTEINPLLSFFVCNEHYVFEAEVCIFGFKQEVILTRCKSSFLCELKSHEQMLWETNEMEYFTSLYSEREIEEVIKEGIYCLFDEILKNLNVGPFFKNYWPGEMLTKKVTKSNKSLFFKFAFLFTGPMENNENKLVLKKVSSFFPEIVSVLSNLSTGKKPLFLTLENTSKWKYNKWKIFFGIKELTSDQKEIVLLFNTPESFLNIDDQKNFFFSLKEATEKHSNITTIMATDSPECLGYPAEIYEGKIRIAFLPNNFFSEEKIKYLKEVIDKIKTSILRVYSSYGNSFKEETKRSKFYENKWIEILSNEHISKLFFGGKILFIEGKEDFMIINHLQSEIDKLCLGGKGTYYKFSEIDIIRIFGKYNYIFYAKFAEEMSLDHKFLLDNDKEDENEKNPPKELEVTGWEYFYKINSSKTEEKKYKERLNSWKEYENEISPKEAQKAWNKGWRFARNKFFYDLTPYCKKAKKDRFCNNVTWIDGNISKLLELDDEKKIWKGLFGISKTLTAIDNFPMIVKLVIENPIIRRECERIFESILKKKGWHEYLWCEEHGIRK